MSEVFEYSPQQVSLIIAGYEIRGWQTIRIARRVKTFQPIYGIRGKNTRVKNLDTSATITLPIIQTSQSNDVLSDILALDSVRRTGRLTIMLKDGSGQSVFSSAEAYIDGFPETGFTGDISFRVWQIVCQSTDSYHIGGNAAAQDSLLNDLLGQVGRIFN